MNDRAGFLFVFVVMLFFGLYAVIIPKSVKKENEEAEFSWVPVGGGRLFGVALLAVSRFTLSPKPIFPPLEKAASHPSV
jgi:hypothetical protein